ncbi:unnamed protein product [Symbiodinium natans]|uniref:Uncharacterized protein n=1 Tax=Symbiodinium natans TaxID=878477 RepID=A0A812S5F0_9DINO|nr:unnamed protein product [Symbiodinium natans]
MGDGFQLQLQAGSWTLGGPAELHLDLVNDSGQPLVLPLGSFSLGTDGATALAACLQLQDLDGHWTRPRLLHPRGTSFKEMVIYLPPKKAIQVPIVGQVLDVGRFGGLVVRIGGQGSGASEVLLPVCERPAAIPPNPRRLLRFALEAEDQRCLTGPICWVGPHEPIHPSPPTWQGEVHTKPCEVVVRRTPVQPPTVKGHVLLQERCPLRRPLVYQHTLVPSLANAPRRTQDPKAPSRRPGNRRRLRRKAPSRPTGRPQSQGLIGQGEETFQEQEEEEEEEEQSALAQTARDFFRPSNSEPVKTKVGQLPSLSIIHHSTAWRKLPRKLDALADPILLEVAEETSRFCSETTVLALCGPAFRTRTGQRYQDSVRSLGFKVVTNMGSVSSLYTWASLCSCAEHPSDLVLVSTWECVGSCLGLLRQTGALALLRGLLVLCSHHDQDQAQAAAKEALPPCRWRVIPSLAFG